MGKCLVTKLNEVIQNNRLPKIGEMVFPLAEEITTIGYASKSDATLRIANGTFDDGSDSKFVNLSEFESTLKFTDKKDAILFIPNKGDITVFSVNSNSGYNSDISLEDIKYMKSVKYMSLSGNQYAAGDIASLPVALISCNLNDTNVSGNIGNMLARIQDLRIDNTSVVGNITEVLKKTYYFSAKNVRGLVGDLANFATEEISSTAIPFISSIGNFDWGSRPSSAMIVALEGCALGNSVDKMLQDQAACKVPEKLSTSSYQWYKIISVKGTRTSASDSAVAALQAKGYTVSITSA